MTLLPAQHEPPILPSALLQQSSLYSEPESRHLFERLLNENDWPDNRYVVAGRQFTLPRLQTWHADPGIVYSYSNNLLQTRPWTPLLLTIKARIEACLNYDFNAVLVNLYRDGNDYVGWHSDDEQELGAEPVIASLSLGATRSFAFRHKSSGESGTIELTCGSLLCMQALFQHEWLHSVPMAKLVSSPRINLTFRKVFMQADG